VPADVYNECALKIHMPCAMTVLAFLIYSAPDDKLDPKYDKRMQQFMPEWFALWVELEAKKIARFKAEGLPDEKNLGVWGRKLLPQKLTEAQARYGHMTKAQIDEYKFSHGHCVKSKY
jgi:hypothetical protein